MTLKIKLFMSLFFYKNLFDNIKIYSNSNHNIVIKGKDIIINRGSTYVHLFGEKIKVDYCFNFTITEDGLKWFIW